MLRAFVLAMITLALFLGRGFAEEIIFDDFTGGDLSQWRTLGNGSATIQSSDLRIVNESLPAKVVYFPDTLPGDASIRTQARVVDGGLGLALNFQQGLWDGYYLSVSDEYGFLFAPGVDGVGVEIYDPVDVGPAAGLDEDVTMQRDLVGDTISAWLWRETSGPPDSPQLSFPLEGHRLLEDGEVGVRAWGESIVRYVQIADSPIPIPHPKQEMQIVVTDALKDVEGDDHEQSGDSPWHGQSLFPSSSFVALPEGKSQLVAMAYRPDIAMGPEATNSERVTFTLSTTTVDKLGPKFADNTGEDATVVFDGPVTWCTCFRRASS